MFCDFLKKKNIVKVPQRKKNDKSRVKKYLYHNHKFTEGKQIKKGLEIFVKKYMIGATDIVLLKGILPYKHQAVKRFTSFFNPNIS